MIKWIHLINRCILISIIRLHRNENSENCVSCDCHGDDDDADDADDDVQGALTRRSLVDSDDRPKDPSCLAEVQLDHWWEAEVASLRATRSVMGRSATRSIWHRPKWCLKIIKLLYYVLKKFFKLFFLEKKNP